MNKVTLQTISTDSTVLALSASGASASVSLRNKQNNRQDHRQDHRTQTLDWVSTQANQQSEQLLPAIADLLSQAQLMRPDVIAVDIGPGAFTSVRVAVGVAQGLALAWGCGLVGVNSLAAMAYSAPTQIAGTRIAAVLDARMGECYAAVFERAGVNQKSTLSQIAAPQLLAYGDFAVWAKARHGAAHWVGNCANLIPEWGQENRAATDTQPDSAGVLAAFDAALALGVLAIFAPEDVQPLYVRNQVAFTTAQRAEQSLLKAQAHSISH